MRVFIAIELPENIKEVLYNIQKQIGSENAKIKWVAKKNLHLTLKFFSEISAAKLEKVKEKLVDLKFEPFEVELSELGFFPSEDLIKVIWVGLKIPPKVFDIQGEIELRLGDLYPKDKRFSVHLTLGRVKLIKNREKFLETLKKIKVEKFRFKISELVLFKSVLTKDGPKYFIIKRF